MNIQKVFNLSFEPLKSKNAFSNFKTKPYPKDSFTKSISFKGDLKENNFINWADENDFLSDLKNNLTKENVLGSGYFHIVYEIPNNEDFVLRAPSYFSIQTSDFDNLELIDDEDENLNVNIGQAVAKIKVPQIGESEHFVELEVLRKQGGKSIGVPPAEVVAHKKNEIPYEAKERKEKYASTLEALSGAPQEAFDTLIQEYKKTTNAGYRFDHLNSNNILFDSEKQKFNFIDMDKAKMPEQYDALLYALLNIDYFNTYISPYPKETEVSDSDKMKAQEETIAVIKKFVKAMQKEGVKFDENNITYEFNTCLATMPFMIFAYKEVGNTNVWQAFEKLGVA